MTDPLTLLRRFNGPNALIAKSSHVAALNITLSHKMKKNTVPSLQTIPFNFGCTFFQQAIIAIAFTLGFLLPMATAADTKSVDPMAAYLAAQENLPVIERSDWINVKTDVTPAAVGDGVADDTAAIQAALSMLNGGAQGPGAVYLPPGTYRITSTLTVSRVPGAAIYGHGRATVIA